MAPAYKNLIFTKHALARMKDRNITEQAVWQTLQKPELTKPEDKPNTTRFIKTINDRKYHVVATHLSETNKTLVISAWVRGEEDAVPIFWQLLTLPFKLSWRMLVWGAKRIFGQKK